MKQQHQGVLMLVLLSLSFPATAAEPLRDPTRPPAAPAVSAPAAPVSKQQVQLALQSVLVSDLRRRAMINDQLVQVGDRLAGLMVVDITSEGVVLKSATETVTLNLPLERVKHWRGKTEQSRAGRSGGS